MMSKFKMWNESFEFIHWAYRRWTAHRQCRLGWPMLDAGYCLDNESVL